MAYNVSYSTLPTFTSNSIGYIIDRPRYTAVNTWQSVPIADPGSAVTLTPGIYTITANISYLSSPNSYAYILLNNSTNNSIFYDGTYHPLSSFTSFQGGNPSTGGDWSYYTNTNWYPVAGQQMRNGVSGSSSALSLSCTVKITTDTQCACLAYSSGSNTTCHTIKIVRTS